MKKTVLRMVVYTKDVEIITGKSGRTARKLLTRVRKHWGKPPRSLVTVEEFCTYTGFDTDTVVAALQ
ncbi:MAG TPA: hypothetical protein VGE66_08185 [Chitinophagaceae bacterium]